MMSSRSSVDRAPALSSGGHGYGTCRGLRYFLYPTLVSCRIIHLSRHHISSCTSTTQFFPLIFILLRFLKNSLLQINSKLNGKNRMTTYKNIGFAGGGYLVAIYTLQLKKEIQKTKIEVTFLFLLFRSK